MSSSPRHVMDGVFAADRFMAVGAADAASRVGSTRPGSRRDCLVLRREWGNGSHIIPNNSLHNPFPHSPLRTRQREAQVRDPLHSVTGQRSREAAWRGAAGPKHRRSGWSREWLHLVRGRKIGNEVRNQLHGVVNIRSDKGSRVSCSWPL